MSKVTDKVVIDGGTTPFLRAGAGNIIIIFMIIGTFLLYQIQNYYNVSIDYRVLIFLAFWTLCILYYSTVVSTITKYEDNTIIILKAIWKIEFNTADIEKFKITHHKTSYMLTGSIKLKGSFWKKRFTICSPSNNIGSAAETKEKLEEMFTEKSE